MGLKPTEPSCSTEQNTKKMYNQYLLQLDQYRQNRQLHQLRTLPSETYERNSFYMNPYDIPSDTEDDDEF
jgi:hypothetical protein